LTGRRFVAAPRNAVEGLIKTAAPGIKRIEVSDLITFFRQR
jgi:hypothetical protein